MIKQTSEKLLRETEFELEQYKVQLSDPLERLEQSLILIRNVLNKLKQIVLAHPFVDEQEEVYFFKKIKPAFYCYGIYATEMYTIETSIPSGDREKQVSFLEEEVIYVERYLSKYAFQYQYYRLNAKDLDHLYFLRGVQIQSTLMPNVPDLDPDFSTTCDYIFSKFKALDMVKEWLNERIAYAKGIDSVSFPSHIESDKEGLSWTGDTINLAELGYGLYHSGQLNNGTAGIGQIFRWLEDMLKVKIGVPAKRFAEIRARKRLSRTKFLDDMKNNIIRKMDQEDGFNPGNDNYRK